MTRLKINVEAEDDAAAVRILTRLRLKITGFGVAGKVVIQYPIYTISDKIGNAVAEIERDGAVVELTNEEAK